jgi:hypothetical protein
MKGLCVRGTDESTGKLALTMIGAGVLLGPIMGLWPLVGILAACGTYFCVANQGKGRR